MVAYHLAEAGVSTAVLDRRDVGLGSTSASTALVLYEVDVLLSDLIKIRGEGAAVRSYEACLEAISKVERIVKQVGDCGFARKKSLYVAPSEKKAAVLREEYEVRRRHGFQLEYLDRPQIEESFSFRRPGALLSYDAAEVDPLLLTHRLLDYQLRRGAVQVRDRTAATRIARVDGGVVIKTDRGFDVTARKVVFATGYETMRYLREKVVRLKSTYAIATQPTPPFGGWGHDRCLIWEAATPYLYLRTTSDGRIMVGGEDEDFVNPTSRDRIIHSKARALLSKVRRMFPEAQLEVEYAWAGTFGETEDSLPYVGEVKGFPNAYFALCYGANGTNFAVIAAEIIRDLYLNKSNPDAEVFGFDRRIESARRGGR